MIRWLWVLAIAAVIALIGALLPANATAGRVYLPNDGNGSAVYIGDDRWLTARHVADLGVLSIRTPTVSFFSVTVEWRCATCDLAVLRTPPQRAVKLETAVVVCRATKIGEAVSYTGSPENVFDMPYLTFFGRVSAIQGTKVLVNIWADKGASGSGIRDAAGDLIGIVSAMQMRWIMHGGAGGGLAIKLFPMSLVQVTPLTEFCVYEAKRR